MFEAWRCFLDKIDMLDIVDLELGNIRGIWFPARQPPRDINASNIKALAGLCHFVDGRINLEAAC